MVLHAAYPSNHFFSHFQQLRVLPPVTAVESETFVQTSSTPRTFHLSVLPPSFDLAIELTENQCRSVCYLKRLPSLNAN